MARSLEVLRVSSALGVFHVMRYINVRYLLTYFTLTLLHFPTGGANDAQNVSVDTARGKDNDQHLFANDNVGYITRSLQMSEDTIILFISS